MTLKYPKKGFYTYNCEYNPISCKEPGEILGYSPSTRVFRKESIDKTHLPEFHQIEGIIMEPGANLGMLVSTLKRSIKRWVIPKFVLDLPTSLTEPSLEVEVKWRGKWLELGGAGIFRPEVTEPLGIKDPVCAWGMDWKDLQCLY